MAKKEPTKLDENQTKLAVRLLECCRDSLLINLRYLDMALNVLTFQPMHGFEGTVTTEGKHMFFDPKRILRVFDEDGRSGAANTRLYLHTVLHCVFKHMFVSLTIDTRLWDLACDIAIQGVINELDLPFLRVKNVSREEAEFFSVTTAAKGATAEKIYAYLMDGVPSKRIEELEELFTYDSHVAWYKFATASGGGGGTTNSDPESEGEGESSGGQGNGGGDVDQSEGGDMFTDFFKGSHDSRSGLSQEWGDIAQRMEQELNDYISKKRGDKAGNLTQNLKELNREKYDYTAFLKKFATRTEVMKINEDEFDYVYYTYGMKLYGKMPLIEPLEYKDDKRIRQFVIAIDTSGSTSGEMVQTFFNKTYNIMKSTESFTSRLELYVIQCDTVIQEIKEIRSLDEFEEYVKTAKVHGQGGTDFRPVFKKIEELQDEGRLTQLKGMIYFTDGCGEYPKKKPPYDTAFVFIDDEYNDYNVPSWAIKLILKKDEI